MDTQTNQLGVFESKFSISIPSSNIWTFLHPFYQKYSHLPAFTCNKTFKSYSFGEISEASLRWAAELRQHRSGEKSPPPTVAVLCPNNIEFPIITLGAFAAGCPLSPVRQDFQPQIVLAMLRLTKPKIMVIDRSVVEQFRKVIEKLGPVHVYVRDPMEGRALPDFGPNCPVKNLLDIVFSDGPVLDIEIAKQVNPDSTALIPFSSGTTGVPKAIITSHKAIINSVYGLMHRNFCTIKEANDSYQETLIGNLPQAHAFGLQFYFILLATKGCRVVDLHSTDLRDLISVAKKFQPQAMTLRSYQMEAMISMEGVKEAFCSVHTIVNSGTLCNWSNVAKLRKITGKNFALMDQYGSSEAGEIAITPLNKHRPGMIGTLVPSCKARFVDIKTGEPITKPHHNGELFVKTLGMMDGYIDQEATKEVFDEDNWFRTGDIGFFDQDNYICIIERFKDLITVKGLKVYPSSIEEVVMKHPKVLDAGVVGVPDLITGEELTRAFVVTKSTVGQQEIMDFVKENASPEKWISGGVVFLDKIPRNHMGKILRKFLREMSWSGKTSF